MRTDQRMTMNIIWISMIKPISVITIKKETRSSHTHTQKRKQHNAQMSMYHRNDLFYSKFCV